MRLVVPYLGNLNIADARLVRLAKFLGCHCELLPLEKGVAHSTEFIGKHVRDKNSCFVVNPATIREWLSSESCPPELASYLTSQFSFVLIHNLSLDPFTASIVSTFSEGSLQSVHPVEGSGLSYEIASGDSRVCGPFSGLIFGPVNPENDQIVGKNPDAGTVRTHIAIGGQPFFASVQRERAEVFVLASADMADLDAKIGGKPLTEYFSQFVPPAMLLRYVFGKECWHPNEHHATLIIDDPLLRKNYGFLNYESLLGLMDEYNFHTSIAFIPHNYLRNSKGITEMFRKRPDRFSICFHGNDHTASEFGTKDVGLLNSMLTVAEARMDVQQKRTGIRCDRVMVFPQGNFSVDAMKVLKAHNFSAAVNSGPYPLGEQVGLTLTEIIGPAILEHGEFPLFLRKYVREFTLQDIAFNIFFGKPVLIVEHHDIFKDPKYLTQLVSRIHTVMPEIRWSNLLTAVESSYLKRWAPDGTLQIWAYSNACRIENASDTLLQCSVEWSRPGEFLAKKVLLDGKSWPDTRIDEKGIQISFDLIPGESRKFSLVYGNEFSLSDANRGLGWKAKAFLRRRFSEIRDNYLIKSPHLLSVVETLQRRLLKNSKL